MEKGNWWLIALIPIILGYIYFGLTWRSIVGIQPHPPEIISLISEDNREPLNFMIKNRGDSDLIVTLKVSVVNATILKSDYSYDYYSESEVQISYIYLLRTPNPQNVTIWICPYENVTSFQVSYDAWKVFSVGDPIKWFTYIFDVVNKYPPINMLYHRTSSMSFILQK